MEGNVIGRINSKMPNLLMYKPERPDIEQQARKYGFESSQELVNYLLAYEPRKELEEKQYQTLLINILDGCAPEEFEIATKMGTNAIKSIIRRCREMAKELLAQVYEKYDEIWARKIRITPELEKHGKEVIAELNRKMPNLLTHNPLCSALDQVAMEYKFDSSQELVDWLLDYKPRTSIMENICDTLARQELGLPTEDYDLAAENYGYDDNLPYAVDTVPF